VVAEDELGSLARRALDELEAGRHARGDRVDLEGARYLKSVGTVVVEGGDIEEVVEVGEDRVSVGHGEFGFGP